MALHGHVSLHIGDGAGVRLGSETRAPLLAHPERVQRPHHEPAGFLCPFAVHIVLLEAAAFFIWLSVFNLLIIPLS